jgi:hypothetical protein
MADDFTHLARADRHIAGAKERVVRQRQLVARLAGTGHSARDAESFLSVLTNVVSIFERHRLLILNWLQP